MLEWRRIKAVRRLVWVAIAFALFPGAFFVVITSWLVGWNPEVLAGLVPSALMGCIAFTLHRFRPALPPAMEHWSPEQELITPLPRTVEARWSTPRMSLPLFLAIFPIFYLALVAAGVKALDWPSVALLTTPSLLATLWVCLKLRSGERQLLEQGRIARGLIRRVLAGRGFFKMKVEYEFDGVEFFSWTENMSPKTWFGPLFVEERKYVTLLIDPQHPEHFVVYPFCGHLVPGEQHSWTRRVP